MAVLIFHRLRRRDCLNWKNGCDRERSQQKLKYGNIIPRLCGDDWLLSVACLVGLANQHF
jgi:hypothetical protein